MARFDYRLNRVETIGELILQLNKIFENQTIQFQRIEGLDEYTSQFFGDVQHTGTNIGVFSTTPAPQQAAITDLSATPSDAEIQTAVNSLIAVLETHGWIASA